MNENFLGTKLNILYLGSHSRLCTFLEIDMDNTITRTESPFPIYGKYDCIISYGYRHKIPLSAINDVKGNAINLHISYLPYNRGANPNYWSWHDNTPKGVTIHYVDEGFDTGDIIVQKLVLFSPQEYTLKTTYDRLKMEIEDLFICNWWMLFQLPRKVQTGVFTCHTTKDRILLTNGWDTRCDSIEQEVFGWDEIE